MILILANYTLPSFDGLSALRIARSELPLVPFIFVSGTLDEDLAIEALKIGATDYVFKTRLSRLAPSVERSLREAAERAELARAEQALRRSEAYLAQAQELSHTGSFGWDPGSGEVYCSRETFRIFGLEPGARVTENLILPAHTLRTALFCANAWTVPGAIAGASKWNTGFCCRTGR